MGRGVWQEHRPGSVVDANYIPFGNGKHWKIKGYVHMAALAVAERRAGRFFAIVVVVGSRRVMRNYPFRKVVVVAGGTNIRTGPYSQREYQKGTYGG